MRLGLVAWVVIFSSYGAPALAAKPVIDPNEYLGTKLWKEQVEGICGQVKAMRMRVDQNLAAARDLQAKIQQKKCEPYHEQMPTSLVEECMGYKNQLQQLQQQRNQVMSERNGKINELQALGASTDTCSQPI